MTRRTQGDEVLVRRAAREVGLWAAVLVTAAMLLLVGSLTYVVVRGQDRAQDSLLRTSVTTADDVGDPPPAGWVVLERASRTEMSAGLPPALAPALARLRAAAGARTGVADLRGDEGVRYRVATVRRPAAVAQVVLDVTRASHERVLLLQALGLACVLALLLAGGLGGLLARRAVRPLAQALALQRAFVADASHELRTPLTLLSTRAQVLDRAVQAAPVDPQVRQDSTGLVQDVQRLGDVVEDLLLAADPAGREQHEPLDLCVLVDGVVASARDHASDTGVTLHSGGPDAACRVTGAAPALRRAVLALVDNAIDHTPPGGWVRVATCRRRDEVVVVVSDTGPGLPAEDLPFAPRRFHSGGQRAGRAHYGLGLALTHDVANRHGGHLRLVPGPGGATFELALPAYDVPR